MDGALNAEGRSHGSPRLSDPPISEVGNLLQKKGLTYWSLEKLAPALAWDILLERITILIHSIWNRERHSLWRALVRRKSFLFKHYTSTTNLVRK